MGIVIPGDIRRAMVSHAEVCLPAECCGLLAFDTEGAVRFAYPLTNSDHSPASYTIEPAEHFGAIRHADRHGWEIEGGFHSHPTTEPVPSATDIANNPGPGWLHVLVGFADDRAVLRAFRIDDGAVREIL